MFVYKFRQWSKFLRELFFSRELFLRIVKKRRKSQKFESGKKLVPHGMSARATFLAFLTVCYVTSHARLAQVTQWHDLF